jgi:hypothetical protein
MMVFWQVSMVVEAGVANHHPTHPFGQSLQLAKGPFKNSCISPRFIDDSSCHVRVMKKMAAESLTNRTSG